MVMPYLDYEAGEAQVGSVGDVEAGVVSILSFVLQSHIHHHPPPVSLYDAQRPLRPSFAVMATESAARLHRLCTELTGEVGRKRDASERSSRTSLALQVMCTSYSNCKLPCACML